MKSITKAQYAMLFFAVDRLKEDSWYTGPYGFDALKERGLVDFGQHDRIITDEGIAFVKRMLADPESMPMTAKRAIAEYDVLRDEYAHLFEHDPDMRVRVAMVSNRSNRRPASTGSERTPSTISRIWTYYRRPSRSRTCTPGSTRIIM